MKQYNMLQALFMSFYSAKLYRDVAQNWGGKAILYLLFLLALSWIPMSGQMQYQLNRVYDKHAKDIIQQTPVMTIKDGKMSTPEARPYFIKLPEEKENIAVIDTTGQYKNLQQANAALLVTQTRVIYSQHPDDVRIKTFPTNLNLIIDPAQVNEKLKQFAHYIWVPFFFFMLIASFIYRLIQALLYSILGKIFAKIGGVSLSYAQIMQVMMIAITPIIIISTVVDFYHLAFPREMLLYFALAMIYLIYGIAANRK